MEKKKKKSNPDKLSERLSKRHIDENPAKRHPNTDDPNEETGPPLKEMPITVNFHREKILD